jgi:murein L,D-transpeptidase YcbB/YkuD
MLLGASGWLAFAADNTVQAPQVEQAPNAQAEPGPASPPAASPPTLRDQQADSVLPMPGATPQAGTPATASPSSASPVVAAIRLKLADPSLAERAPPDDLAALQAFYAARGEAPIWMTDMGFSAVAQAAIDEILKADEWGLDSAAFDLPAAGDLPATAEAKAESEIKLDLAILQYARFARGGRTVPSELSEVIDQRPSLRDPNTVLAEIAAAPQADAYLRSLHPQHEQFRRLREALLAARAAAKPDAKPDDIQRLLINMERWRWMPEDLGQVYVWINIPEFMVHVVKDGKAVYAEKIVIGKPAYATPVFSAALETIVFNPEWTVPETIIREDLLPKLRAKPGLLDDKDSNLDILREHKLKVRYNGHPVDPRRINWNRVNMSAISFVQPPGPSNVLGKVKFLYPNEHAVYMHDTIKRKLFKNAVRAEGHHCPRVANPDKFAEILLAEDKGWGPDEIKKLLAEGNNSAVDLDHPIPVHTTYFTALVDDGGKVETFADIYKLDALMAAALLNGNKKAEAIAANAEKAKPPKPADAGQPAGNLAASAR